MNEILDREISEMVDMAFECSCGRSHSVDIKKIFIERNITRRILDTLAPYKNGKILLVADSNTFRISGKQIKEALDLHGFSSGCHVFESRGPLVPDEKAVGRLVIETDEEIALILAVGSGTLNDLSRMVSHKLGVPYMIAGTAPSMDGYASTVSPLIVQGRKKTYKAVYPVAIFGDLDAMMDSPKEMICAGFGDLLGKYTALADWKLSASINGEYLCPTCVTLVNNAIEKCTASKEGIAARKESAIRYLAEALIMTGIAIGLAGDSRPASGSEHHLAHYWETDALARGVEHPLHGNSVGVGTVVISHIYKMVGQTYNINDMGAPDPDTVRGLLRAVGAVDNPFDLGIDKKVFTESVLHAKEIRPRYTVLHLAEKLGILESAAFSLTEMFYG